LPAEAVATCFAGAGLPAYFATKAATS
jgi:hypothetical protein